MSQKYIIVSTSKKEEVLHSYLRRVFAAVYRELKTVKKSYVLESRIISPWDIPTFISFCRATVPLDQKQKLKIKRAHVPKLDLFLDSLPAPWSYR